MRHDIYDEKELEFLPHEDEAGKHKNSIIGFLAENKKSRHYNSDWNAVYCLDTSQLFYNEIGVVINPEKENVFKEEFGGCHHALNRFVDKSTTFICSMFTKSYENVQSKEFLETILDEKKSPYRDALEDVTILRDKKRNNLPLAIVFRNLPVTNLQLAVNFLICSRLHSTWRLSGVWKHMVDSGVLPYSALSVSTIFARNRNYDAEVYKGNFPKGSLHISGPYAGDQPFNLGYGFHPYRFTTVNYNKYFCGLNKTGARPNPCNRIWDDKKNYLSLSRGENPKGAFDKLGILDSLFKKKSINKDSVDYINKVTTSKGKQTFEY